MSEQMAKEIKMKCFRCESFNVNDEQFTGIFKIPVFKHKKMVNILHNGEFFENISNPLNNEESHSVIFPYVLCNNCCQSFRRWMHDQENGF